MMNSEFMKKLMDRANRSLFFFAALLFHLVLALIIATIVIFQAPSPPKEDFQQTYVPTAPPPPPPPQATQTVAVSPTPVPTTAAAITSTSTMPSFTVPMPQIDATIDPNVNHNMTKSISMQGSGLNGRLVGIRGTVGSWRSADNIREAGGDVHNLVAKFPVFLAQYADGDWDTNNYFNDQSTSDTPTSGCLPNLCNKIEEWSHNSLQAAAIKAIPIDSPDLLTKPPPYIFFTGHKDFHLTDDEITNLRKYLQVGGCIWGDSAFSGDGSRFDVAFHREMKKVLPDPDIVFQDLPMNHPIFAKSWFPITVVPKGMNYRQDPVEYLNLDGKLAIIYTPNDYSDMMTAALVPGADEGSAAFTGANGFNYSAKHPLYTPLQFSWDADTFYRNYTPAAAMQAFKLSMNILSHLLIRFDADLLLGH
jgi:hypothetical protein